MNDLIVSLLVFERMRSHVSGKLLAVDSVKSLRLRVLTWNIVTEESDEGPFTLFHSFIFCTLVTATTGPLQ